MNKVLEYIIKATDKTHGAILSAKTRLADFTTSIATNLTNIQSGFSMMQDAISTAASAIGSTIREAFRFETTTVQFAVLMGSMNKAIDRMKELAKFAAETPFELEGIAKASRTLHVFSDGAMGGQESLRLVGDAAASVGTSLEELSFWVGRAYSMIKGGQPFGEAAMRLQELGVLTPEVRQKMESLQSTGASASEVWGALSNRLSEFNGGMKMLSKTGEGLMSTLNDTAAEAKRTFGQEFLDAAKTAIEGLTTYLQKFIDDGSIKQWAQKSLEYIYMVAGAIKAIWEGGSDRQKAIGAVKDIVVGSFSIAAQKAMNILIENAPNIGLAIGNAIMGVTKKAFKLNADHEQYKQAAFETGVLNASSTKDIAKSMLHQDWWSVPDDKKDAYMNRARELIDQKYLKENKQKPLDVSYDQLNRGLSVLDTLSAGLKGKVDTNAKVIQEAIEGVRNGKSSGTPNPIKAIADDMAKADALLATKRKEKELADAIEKEKKANEEKKKLTEKALEDEHKARIDNVRKEIEVRASEENKANDRLSRAKAEADKAWGWYRDPESFKRQLNEEKANAVAEKKFKKEFSSLTRRSNWRTRTLNDNDEAVRRVGLAREERDNAEKALMEIKNNTAGVKELLEELLTQK